MYANQDVVTRLDVEVISCFEVVHWRVGSVAVWPALRWLKY